MKQTFSYVYIQDDDGILEIGVDYREAGQQLYCSDDLNYGEVKNLYLALQDWLTKYIQKDSMKTKREIANQQNETL